MVTDCSRGNAGQMGSERIECSAVRTSDTTRVPRDMLERAFNTITRQLSSLIIPDSSVVSGMYIHYIYVHKSIILSALYAGIHTYVCGTYIIVHMYIHVHIMTIMFDRVQVLDLLIYVHKHRVIFVHTLLPVENGFCNFEVQETDHGIYNWNETMVGHTDEQTCVFGTKVGFDTGKATRSCMSHDVWSDYDGDACISEITYRIRQIAEVHTYLHKSSGI